MKPIQGTGTLTFEDGTVAEIERVHVEFCTQGGVTSGQGTFRHDNVFSLVDKVGSPTLACGGVRVKVIISSARGDGIGVIQTNGAPLA